MGGAKPTAFSSGCVRLLYSAKPYSSPLSLSPSLPGVVISFSAMSYSSNEGGSFVIVTIDKEGDTNFDTSIRLQTIDDTAIGMAA